MAVRREALTGAVFVLETLQNVSGNIPIVPILYPVVTVALNIAKTMQSVQGARDRAARLALKVANLVEHINTVMTRSENIDSALHSNVTSLLQLLKRIQADLDEITSQRFLQRLLKHGRNAAMLDDHLNEVDSARQSFDTATLISLHRRLDIHASQSEGALQKILDSPKEHLQVFLLQDIHVQIVEYKSTMDNILIHQVLPLVESFPPK